MSLTDPVDDLRFLSGFREYIVPCTTESLLAKGNLLRNSPEPTPTLPKGLLQAVPSVFLPAQCLIPDPTALRNSAAAASQIVKLACPAFGTLITMSSGRFAKNIVTRRSCGKGSLLVSTDPNSAIYCAALFAHLI